MLFSHVCLSSTSASASPKHDPLGFVFALYIERQKDDPLASTGAYYIKGHKACRHFLYGLAVALVRG